MLLHETEAKVVLGIDTLIIMIITSISLTVRG